MNFLSHFLPLNCWKEGVREQLGEQHLSARQGQSTTGVEKILLHLLSHLKTLLPSCCMCPTAGTWKLEQQQPCWGHAVCWACFISESSSQKNPATLHLLALWQILRLSIVSDYFCEVRQMKHFSNPGWLVGWKLWSLVQRSYLPLQWGSGKAGKVCNCGIFSGHLVPVPPQTSHRYFQLSLPQFNLHCCVCSGQKISGKRLFSILNEPLLNEPTRKPLCRKQNKKRGATQK